MNENDEDPISMMGKVFAFVWVGLIVLGVLKFLLDLIMSTGTQFALLGIVMTVMSFWIVGCEIKIAVRKERERIP